MSIEICISANGKWRYDMIYFGKSMNDWVQEAHKYNCKLNNWYYKPLEKGLFGYDNIVCSLGHLFEFLLNNNNHDEETLAEYIHLGWCENYIFYRDNSMLIKQSGYKMPSKPINDDRRNKCAITSYKDLPEDEKEKDRIFVKYVLSSINK